MLLMRYWYMSRSWMFIWRFIDILLFNDSPLIHCVKSILYMSNIMFQVNIYKYQTQIIQKSTLQSYILCATRIWNCWIIIVQINDQFQCVYNFKFFLNKSRELYIVTDTGHISFRINLIFFCYLCDIYIKAWNTACEHACRAGLCREDRETWHDTEVFRTLEQKLQVILVLCCVTNCSGIIFLFSIMFTQNAHFLR